MSNNSLIAKYRDRLPISNESKIISLGEGNTPLIQLHSIAHSLDKDVEIYVKYEGVNPTGSFKDRGMTMAVTQAVAEGSKAIICASTGNTSASAAAYAARAGLQAFVIIPAGKVAQGKLAQAIMTGATIIQIQGNFDAGMELVKQVTQEAPVTMVNSVNPYRLQGQKTIAFEVIEALGEAPDFHCLPVGNAGNITAHWIGYSEYATNDCGHVTKACNFCDNNCKYAGSTFSNKKPKMVGYQATQAAPFMRKNMVDNPETVATAIRIGHPQSWDLAWHAHEESGGWFDEHSDAEILAAQKLLAEQEGIFCEPASAASLAGAMHDISSGKIPSGSVVVCTLTGHGLKDTETAIANNTAPIINIETKTEAVEKIILENI
ncbi:Threonine synthase [uncultured Candidatus Thioglobus sp.]|nr:Threonine synthase [uncultured Candidatus Thioglobus sp.]